MAEYSGKKAPKGILKNSSDKKCECDPSKRKSKQTKWDEMNIIATLHPPDKDYGHMKVEEPKTPFNWASGSDSDDETDAFDPNDLASRLTRNAAEPPKSVVLDSDSDEEMEVETDEQKAKRSAFEAKRKAHYNEYAAVKLARRLMQADSEVLEDADNKNVTNTSIDDGGGLKKC
ncbi:protein phosphatase inhibitor 2 [Anabrus simplex]|uniref:protein phosphatase inhibitor 2 n=1 Tax=Anabrus simplex TaxID=316456 RepID=UPI0035A31F75